MTPHLLRLKARPARMCAAATVGLLMLATASACSSSSSGSSGSSDGNGAGSPIKIATVGSFSGVSGHGLPEVRDAIQARVDEINANGGINGRKVDLTVCDDQNDPNRATQCVQTAISKGVVAFVGESSPSFDAFEPLLKQAGIASIGTIVSGKVDGTSPISFAFSPDVSGAFIGMPQLLAKDGSKKLSLIYQSDLGSASAGLKALFEAGVKASGASVAHEIGLPGTTADFSPAAATAVSGSDGVVAYMSGLGQAQVVKAIRQQNPTIPVSVATFALTKSVISALGSDGNGLKIIGLTAPITADVQGAKMYQSDMDKYEPKADRTDQAMLAWSAVWVFERIAKELGSDISRDSVLAKMKTLSNLDMGGILPPLSTTSPCTTCGGQTQLFGAYVMPMTLENGELSEATQGEFLDPFTGKTTTVTNN